MGAQSAGRGWRLALRQDQHQAACLSGGACERKVTATTTSARPQRGQRRNGIGEAVRSGKETDSAVAPGGAGTHLYFIHVVRHPS